MTENLQKKIHHYFMDLSWKIREKNRSKIKFENISESNSDSLPGL